MVLFTPLIWVIFFFAIYLVLYSLNPLYVNFFLALMFLWIQPNLSQTLGGYYTNLIFFVLIAGTISAVFKVDQNKEGSIFGLQFKGFQWLLLNLILGGGILVVMAVLQGRTSASILGVASLSAAPAVTLLSTLTPAIAGLLGLIENRFLFTIIDILKVFFPELLALVPFLVPLAIPLAPLFIVFSAAWFFAILHVSAYGFQTISLIFAFMVAVIWSIMYFVFDNSVAADISHFLWNSLIKLGTTLKIVTNQGSGLEVLG